MTPSLKAGDGGEQQTRAHGKSQSAKMTTDDRTKEKDVAMSSSIPLYKSCKSALRSGNPVKDKDGVHTDDGIVLSHEKR